MIREDTQYVRDQLVKKWLKQDIIVAPNGVKTLELAPVTFRVTENTIFGNVNTDYAKAELAWYESQSLYVKDIPGGPPKIWQEVASREGKINSNYGWAIYSRDNGNQYENVCQELSRDPTSRRGMMIYTRPSMHDDQSTDGMRDFMCTSHVQYLIRDGALVAHVVMRSNDAVFGFKNDLHWQQYVQKKLADDLRVPTGDIVWTAGSLHVYERHFYLVDGYYRSGDPAMSKETYANNYSEMIRT